MGKVLFRGKEGGRQVEYTRRPVRGWYCELTNEKKSQILDVRAERKNLWRVMHEHE